MITTIYLEISRRYKGGLWLKLLRASTIKLSTDMIVWLKCGKIYYSLSLLRARYLIDSMVNVMGVWFRLGNAEMKYGR